MFSHQHVCLQQQGGAERRMAVEIAFVKCTSRIFFDVTSDQHVAIAQRKLKRRQAQLRSVSGTVRTQRPYSKKHQDLTKRRSDEPLKNRRRCSFRRGRLFDAGRRARCMRSLLPVEDFWKQGRDVSVG
jgi:hypothetical protein